MVLRFQGAASHLPFGYQDEESCEARVKGQLNLNCVRLLVDHYLVNVCSLSTAVSPVKFLYYLGVRSPEERFQVRGIRLPVGIKKQLLEMPLGY